MEAQRFPSERVGRQISAVLQGWGMPAGDVTVTADVLLEADLRGVESHGISLLPVYANWAASGKLHLQARPRTLREGPAFALIDAGAGLGFAVSVHAMGLAVEKARGTGIAAVSVTNSHHFGAAGYYARLAARAGLIGMVTTSTRVISVVPTNGTEPVLGTNPLAIAVPAPGPEPIVLDMATSTVAANKVRMRHLKGDPLPPGWVMDGQGAPVTDPHEAYRVVYEQPDGGLSPLGGGLESGGYKGYGLGLMLHFLGGTLAGATFPPLRAKPPAGPAQDNIGHLFLALDPQMFRSREEFLEDVAGVAATLRGARPADPARPVLLPGDPEAATRQERVRTGIPLATALLAQLRGLAGSLHVPFLLE